MSFIPIYLLPGMGADERLFSEQIKALPQIKVMSWIKPHRLESLDSYSARLAALVDSSEPCYIGGASFGGFVAMEMVRHLNAKGCFLIGSVRSPQELPKRITALRPVAPLANIIPYELTPFFTNISSSISTEPTKKILDQLSESEAYFLRWACWAVLNWDTIPDVGNVPIHQIHGEKDSVLPIKFTTPDHIITGGGHVISMTHPDEITNYFVERLQNPT